MSLFADSNVKIDVLKKRAFNYRWAEVPEGMIPLTAADPDYPVAPEIRQALMEYVQDGYFSYTPKLGYPEFAQSISRALKERKGEQIVAEAKDQAVYMKQKAEMEIEQEKRKAFADVKSEISGIAVEIASKVVSREIDEKDHEALIQDFIDRMGEAV